MEFQKIELSKNWRFHLGDVPQAWSKTYEDVDWQKVCVPHDWSVSLPFSKEYSSGTGYVAGGIGWYRCSFHLDEKYKNCNISIVFDGVYKNSQVWCNSYYKGMWPYGYTTFRYDLTNQVVFGDEENLITVKVNHTDIADSRWFTGSGITRKVYLLIEEAVHPIQDGIFFETITSSSKEAQLQISNEIMNTHEERTPIYVKNVLFDQKGQEVLTLSSHAAIEGNETTTLVNTGTLTNPELWSIEHPTLYTLKTYLSVSKDVTPFDSSWYLADVKKVGIRSFSFDPNKGFFLNNISTKLKGVCLHHDAGCLGAAVVPEIWLRRLEKLKEMGCNAIRMSHNPHMPELYDLCDAMGFVVMDEAFDEWEGVKNKWSTGHNVYPPKHEGYFEFFPEWHEKDLRALIRRDRNHPSIIMWSIGNEIDYPNDPYCHPSFQTMTGNNDKDKPEAERLYSPHRPNALHLATLAATLTKLVREDDHSRPVTLASAFPELSTQTGLYDTLDVVGYNYKEHLYIEGHNLFPNTPILGSENGHGYKEWRSVTDNDYISGQFLWTGIDYLGEAHGWPIHGSGAGILNLAGFEKTGYYRRQSFWSATPCLHLTTTRTEENSHEWTTMYESWNYVPGEMVEVRCYTNLREVELFCNEVSHGTKNFDSNLGYICWNIPFSEGTLKAIGAFDANTSSLETTLVSTSAACQIQVKTYETAFPKIQAEYTSSSPLHQLEVTVQDSHGNRVINDASLLTVTALENGELIGLENGDLADITPYTSSSRRAYEGRLVVYIRKTNKENPTTLTITGSNLKSYSITL